MSKSSVKYFQQTLTPIRKALSTSFQDVATAGLDDSDIMEIYIVNTGASIRTITVARYDGVNTDTILVYSIPANAGTVVGVNSVKLVSSNLIPGALLDVNSNYFIRLKNGYKIQIKQDVGTDLIALGIQMDY